MKENVAYKGFKDVNTLQHVVNGLNKSDIGSEGEKK